MPSLGSNCVARTLLVIRIRCRLRQDLLVRPRVALGGEFEEGKQGNVEAAHSCGYVEEQMEGLRRRRADTVLLCQSRLGDR